MTMTLGSLERRELAIDKRSRHIVAAAAGDPRAHQLPIRLEINEAQAGADALAQPVAVDALERR